MSLVNEMLNDLQKDHKQTSTIEGMSATPQTSNNTLLYFVVATIIAFFMVYFFYKKPIEIQPEQSIEKAIITESEKQQTETPLVKATTEKKIDPKQSKPLEKTEDSPLAQSESPVEPSTELVTTTKQKEKPSFIAPPAPAKETATIAEPVKKVSRKTLADKEISKIIGNWSNLEENASFNLLKKRLDSYKDFPSLWIKALSFIKPKNDIYYENLLSRAMIIFPKKDSFKLMAARLSFIKSDYVNSEQLIENTDENNWSRADYQIAALVSQKVNKHKQAINYYKNIVAGSPNNGEINMAIGISYQAINQKKLATKHFRLALLDSKLNQIQKRFIEQQLVSNQG